VIFVVPVIVKWICVDWPFLYMGFFWINCYAKRNHFSERNYAKDISGLFIYGLVLCIFFFLLCSVALFYCNIHSDSAVLSLVVYFNSIIGYTGYYQAIGKSISFKYIFSEYKCGIFLPFSMCSFRNLLINRQSGKHRFFGLFQVILQDYSYLFFLERLFTWLVEYYIHIICFIHD